MILEATMQLLKESDAIDLAKDPKWRDVFYEKANDKAVTRLRVWLRDHKEDTIRLYHGTSAEAAKIIDQEGILPTNSKRRNSLQSASGYVYLTVYPNMAKNFAQMGSHGQEVVVYSVDVPVKKLLADSDQIKNKRMWSREDIKGRDLATSLAYGYGARVKGKIYLYQIQRLD